MNKKHVSIALTALILGTTAFKVTVANENKPEEVKGVRYYVANTKGTSD